MDESLPAATQPTAGTGNRRTKAQSAAFTPVRAKRGYEYIVEQVRDAIHSGRFKPGDQLPTEREMAEAFKVSRHGVREAIRGLESNGLVEVRLGVLGGIFVREGDPRTVTRALSDLASLGAFSSESLLEARILLSSDVLRLACERATKDDLQRLEDDIVVVENLVAEPGAERTSHLTEFYRLLAAATHNEVLVALTDSLAQIVHARLNRAAAPPNPDIGRIRRNILNYIRERDAEHAVEEITQHLTQLEHTLLAAEQSRRAQGGVGAR
ncbi:GntR family transcriptional regulator [Streptomyces sp. ITFR-16]|uniref:FadR/GntR family transcriptional regulator n=1 Tax=Streptomyces sp. ITFR-16 TaxID=3075198 RepID=UPI002889BB3E|nr:GntR family transcriptional regulator [Streptomyces sp. ITFR-16]WNI21433.1 GntR family transcriptional regulator [Streptomyces sp. ITFR-16]